MQEKRSKNCRSRNVQRSRSYAGRDTAKHSVSSSVGYLKGKSTLMIFERHANLKYRFGNRHFWCRGYYVDTVGKNAKKIQEYIRNQLQEDWEYDQMTPKEYIDPFYGRASKNKQIERV